MNRVNLSSKEEKFCYEYVLHLNATKAAINAGYSKKTARQIGSKLLTKVNIKDRIDEMKINLAETAGISALRIIREHEKIAFSSIAHLHNTWVERAEFETLPDDQKACIKSISTKVIRKVFREMNAEGVFENVPYDIEFVKIELYDKQKSLDSINTMLGYNSASKVDLTTGGSQIGNASLSQDQIDKLVDSL